MRRMMTAAAAALIALAAAPAFADPPGGRHDNGRYDDGRHDNGRHEGWERGRHEGFEKHRDWRPGHRMDRAYWDRGERVDWRRHHLRRPPPGYEWRDVDGDYVLAAIATGLIASIIANSR